MNPMENRSDDIFKLSNCTDRRPTWFWNSTEDLDCIHDCPKGHWSSHYGFNSISVVNGKCSGPNDTFCSSRVSLSFQSSYKTVKTVRWEKTSLELLSEIGGHLGLFVGVSLMTLAEIGEYIVYLCFNACKRLMETNRIVKTYPKREENLNCNSIVDHPKTVSAWTLPE